MNSDNALIKLLLIVAHADEHYHENENKLKDCLIINTGGLSNVK